MTVVDQLRNQGITVAAVIAVAVSIVWAASAFNTSFDFMNERIASLHKKLDRTVNTVDSVQKDVGTIKMNVHGLEIKVKNVDDDIERVTREVSLTRSQGVKTGRSVESIKDDLNIGDADAHNLRGR